MNKIKAGNLPDDVINNSNDRYSSSNLGDKSADVALIPRTMSPIGSTRRTVASKD